MLVDKVAVQNSVLVNAFGCEMLCVCGWNKIFNYKGALAACCLTLISIYFNKTLLYVINLTRFVVGTALQLYW